MRAEGHLKTNMPGILLVLAAASLVAGLLMGRTASRGTGGLVPDSPSADLGALTVASARDCKHQFLLRNLTSRPIRIIGRTVTCSCTGVDVTDRPIPPGQSVPVLVRADWSAKPGHQEVDVRLKTDDPAHPNVVLTLSGFVKVPCVLSPDSVSFGMLAPGERCTRNVDLSEGTDGRSFRILKAISSSPNVTVARVDPGGAQTAGIEGGPGAFRVTIKSPRSPGYENASVVFLTDLKDMPELRLSVDAQFTGAMVATPASLVFCTGPGAQATQDVRVEGSGWKTDASAEIVLDNAGQGIFSVRKVGETSADQRRTVVFAVTFKPAVGEKTVTRGKLRAVVDSDSVEVPLMGLMSSTNSTPQILPVSEAGR